MIFKGFLEAFLVIF